MVNLIKTFSQLVTTSVYGLATKILSILLSIWLDGKINHNVSNFIGLVVNAAANFLIMRHIFEGDGKKASKFIPKYSMTIIFTVIVGQLLYMIFYSYMKKYHEKWFKDQWDKDIFLIRYLLGAVTYVFFEFPLQKFWVFDNR